MIETKDLTKKYRSVLALDRLNLTIKEGDIFGFIGPNGAGKTTAIRMLCGLLKPTEGTAIVAGVNVKDHPRKVKELVGYLPDAFGVYAGMRVWEYLDFFGAAYRIPKKVRNKRVEEILEVTGCEEMRDYFVETLSHGMRQRVGLAKTLVHDPKVLMLDEPTSGLDPRARIEIRNLMKKLKKLGKTLIISSHILPELSMICDQIGIIEQGKLLCCGSVDAVMKTVQQQRVVEIEVLDNTEKAAELIRSYSSLEGLKIDEQVERMIRIAWSGRDEDMAAMLSYLVGNGVSVLRFNEVQPDLEAIYLKVTEDAKAGSRLAG